jgi:hypothetical protein
MKISHPTGLKNISKSSSTIEFPFYVTADDYHEFSFLQMSLESLTKDKDIEYKELGCDRLYHAVFYKKSQLKDLQEEINALIKDFDENGM